jgi:type III secretion system FlhB-like substrate exporter
MIELMNTQTFSQEIEKIVQRGRGVSYMEAIVHYCEKNDIEIETGAKLINSVIKKRLEAEASELNCLKDRSPQLPI